MREPKGALQIPPVGRDDKGRGVTQVGVVAGWKETRSRDYASQEGLQIPPVGRDDKGRGVTQVRVVAGWKETKSRDCASQEGLHDKGRGVTFRKVRPGSRISR